MLLILCSSIKVGRSFWRERVSSIGSLTKTANGKTPARCAKSWELTFIGLVMTMSTKQFGTCFRMEMTASNFGQQFIKTPPLFLVMK